MFRGFILIENITYPYGPGISKNRKSVFLHKFQKNGT